MLLEEVFIIKIIFIVAFYDKYKFEIINNYILLMYREQRARILKNCPQFFELNWLSICS